MKVTSEELKAQAGEAAAARVADGQVLGLGTGSTVRHFLRSLGQRIRDGGLQNVSGVPTSEWTRDVAAGEGIPLVDLREGTRLDLAVDGADEVCPRLNLVKGLGGALLREKIVAQAARRFLVIVDEGKVVPSLGVSKPVPVELIPFAWSSHFPFFRRLGAAPHLRTREDGQPYVTDNGNYVADLTFPDGLTDPTEVEDALRARAGVVTSGLFLEMATEVLIGGAGGVRSVVRGEAGAWS